MIINVWSILSCIWQYVLHSENYCSRSRTDIKCLFACSYKNRFSVCCFVGKTCSCFLKPFRFKIVLAPVWLQNKLALSSCYLSCWGHAHGIIWKPWDFYIRKLKKFRPILKNSISKNRMFKKKKSNYENWRKLRRKLKLAKLHCTECDLKGQKGLCTWLQRLFFCNLAFKYNMNWRQEIQIVLRSGHFQAKISLKIDILKCLKITIDQFDKFI